MCGIVLTGCNFTLSANEMSIFEKLVMFDTIRGSHSTGVMAGYKFYTPQSEEYVIVGKEAVDGFAFVNSKTWADVSTQKYRASATATVDSSRNPHFLVGHNRYATMGAKTTENAHPFTQGNITLVHNGTLSNQSLLPDYKDFEVDSNNICHSINKIGIEETIQKLNGAFTLIWHDAEKKTVNIIRNEERPFHLARTSTGTWFGASEEEMLMWLLTRDTKYSFSKYSPTIAEHFECEVGVQYIFNVEGGKFELVEQVKHELPTFPVYNNYSRWNDYYDYYNRPAVPAQDRYKALFDKAALGEYKIGSKMWFLAYDFEKYAQNATRGKVVGMINRHPVFVEVHNHGFDAEDYEEDAYYQGIITSIYEYNGIITVIVKDSTREPAEDDNEDHNIDDVAVMEDGSTFTQQEWEEEGYDFCIQCGMDIPFKEAHLCAVKALGCVCKDCRRDSYDVPAETQEAEYFEDAPFQQEDTFTCITCGRPRDISEESSESEVCYYCHAASTPMDQTTELDDGTTVTKREWMKMNTCSFCGDKIPFESATYSLIEKGKVTCIQCYL